MRRRLAAARRLTLGEWQVLGEAWICLLFVHLTLPFLQLERVQRVLGGLQAGARRSRAPREEPIPRLVALTRMATRLQPGRIRCLQRSLALQLVLRRRGVATELCIGVRREGARLLAHAWLDHEGVPLGEPEGCADRFAPLRRVAA